MTRAPVRTPVRYVSEGERSYHIRIDSTAADQIKQAKEIGSASWVTWVGAALKRLQEEDAVEIESLITQAQFISGSNKEKVRLPFRIKNADFDTARVLAQKYNVDIQSVLVAAIHLYSFVSCMAPYLKQAEIEALLSQSDESTDKGSCE